VICTYEGRCALRLAHASNPENTIDEQAVDLAIAWNKSLGAPALRDRPPNVTSLVSGSKSAALSSICRVIAVLLSMLEYEIQLRLGRSMEHEGMVGELPVTQVLCVRHELERFDPMTR
jgi:hypothetical protein